MNTHQEHLKIKNALPFRIIKGVFKISVKLLKFSLHILLGSSSYDEEVEEFREWQDDYDEQAKSITRHEPF